MVLAIIGGTVWWLVASGRLGSDRDQITPSSTPTALTANATLIRVVDGDTVDAMVGSTRERIRLIGIDTPETKKEHVPVQCYGPEASAFTASLLPRGESLYLERDVVGRDDYGRLLAYVYRARDGVFVNAELVRQGYARLLTIPPNVAHATEFVAASADANRASRGLWGACDGIVTSSAGPG